MISPSQLQSQARHVLIASGQNTFTFSKRLGVQHCTVEKAIKGEKMAYQTTKKITEALKRLEPEVAYDPQIPWVTDEPEIEEAAFKLMEPKSDRFIPYPAERLERLKARARETIKAAGIRNVEFALRAGISAANLSQFFSGSLTGFRSAESKEKVLKIEAELDRMAAAFPTPHEPEPFTGSYTEDTGELVTIQTADSPSLVSEEPRQSSGYATFPSKEEPKAEVPPISDAQAARILAMPRDIWGSIGTYKLLAEFYAKTADFHEREARSARGMEAWCLEKLQEDDMKYYPNN